MKTFTKFNSQRNHLSSKNYSEIKNKSIKIARDIANALELNGFLVVEMFLTKDNKILINELAPRPHNSGHWTMDSCRFSQFDNLISLITKGKIYSPEPLKVVRWSILLDMTTRILIE